VSNLQQWLAAVFGHWQHWMGGAAIGSVVALAVVFVQHLFNRRISGKQSAAIFLLCFGTDVSYLAWQDQFLLNRPREARHNSVLAAATQPIEQPPVEQPLASSGPQEEAGVLANDILAFYADRTGQQPAAPRGTDPTAAEWNQYWLASNNYNLKTLSEFKNVFGARLTDVLDNLSRAGADTVEAQAVFRNLSYPSDVKDIAARLGAISKQ
jgi:hypothetical protein